MKLDQIAYYAHDEKQVAAIKELFGLSKANWVEDIVVGEVKLGDSDDVHLSKAHLMFNYDLGIELEILTYLEGPHWHMNKQAYRLGEPFVSHIGFHMGENEEVPNVGATLQRMRTLEHTNPYLLERKRTYVYNIQSSPFGVDFKYIWRIENNV